MRARVKVFVSQSIDYSGMQVRLPVLRATRLYLGKIPCGIRADTLSILGYQLKVCTYDEYQKASFYSVTMYLYYSIIISFVPAMARRSQYED
ncbi:hypothetical protein K458DRAFT_26041 [Lentithecium fluviatile CBS 122367]|uniref:Uncharacterized protein n=1 Tax=Lentithecium fluviatile CBS 122367 TaxID=1168545 RepID=A0A6G1J3E1_9PLEO|nr:hypothetical protein K458DRAFT_26041 [Lentithecium fluviatile CBS 122367]